MRDFSKVYHNVWHSQKFNALPDAEAKLLYLYVLSSPHCNSSGCYDLKAGYVVADLEWEIAAYRKAMDSLLKVGLVEAEAGLATVFITKWMEFNEPTNARHALGIFAHLDLAASERLKCKRAQEVIIVVERKKYHYEKAVGPALERLCQGYRERIERLSAPRPDQDQRPETRPDLRPDLDLDAREVAREALRDCAKEGASLTPQGTGKVHLLETNFLKRGA